MPTAICTCGKTLHWRAQRGARLANMRCECGGKLSRAVWSDDGWTAAPSEGKTKGRKMESCALCGRRRSVPGGGVRLKHDTVFQVYSRGEPYDPQPLAIPAGAVICWSHSPEYPVLITRSTNSEH